MLLKECSSSHISGEVDAALLVEVVPVSGFVVVDDASELLEWPLVLLEELPLEAWLSVHVDGELGNTTEGSFIVVSLELGCELAV